MLKRRRPVDQAEFEAELTELGQTLWTPATPDVRSQIHDALRFQAAAQRRGPSARMRSLRPMLAFASLLVIGVVAFAAIPSARAQMAAWLGIGQPQIGVHVIAVNNTGPTVLSAQGYGKVSVGCGREGTLFVATRKPRTLKLKVKRNSHVVWARHARFQLGWYRLIIEPTTVYFAGPTNSAPHGGPMPRCASP